MKKALTLILATLIALPAAAQQISGIEWPPQPPANVRDLSARLAGNWIIVVDAEEGDTITHHVPLKNTAIMGNDTTVTAAHNRGNFRYGCTATLPTGAQIECEEMLGNTGWRFVGGMVTPHRYDGILIFPGDDVESVDARMIKVH